jgi:hypothetical protein
MAPVNAAGFAFGSFAGIDVDTTIAIARILGFVAAVAAGALLFSRSAAIGGTRALGIALTVFACLGATLFPWYLTWGIVVLAAAGPRALRSALLFVSVGLCFLVTPVGGVVLDNYVGVMKVALALGALALDAAVALIVIRACRHRQPRVPEAVRLETVGSTVSTT